MALKKPTAVFSVCNSSSASSRYRRVWSIARLASSSSWLFSVAGHDVPGVVPGFDGLDGSGQREDLRAARPEVGEPGEELLGRRGGRLVKMDRVHGRLLDRGLCRLPQSGPGGPVAPVETLVLARTRVRRQLTRLARVW